MTIQELLEKVAQGYEGANDNWRHNKDGEARAFYNGQSSAFLLVLRELQKMNEEASA